ILDLIATHDRVQVERIGPLGGVAVRELARRALGDVADERVAAACLKTTGGNPFYLQELLLALGQRRGSTSEELATLASELAPASVARMVRVRIARLGSPAAAVA